MSATTASAATPAATTSLRSSIDSTYQTNGRVSAIVTVGSVTYIGGSFTAVRPSGSSGGSVSRQHLAAISSSTGQLLSWNPSADGNVLALARSADGNTIFAGGTFSQAGGASRLRLAALSASSGSATSFNVSVNQQVQALAVSGSNLYLGGTFTTVGGQSRSRLAEVSTSGSVNSTWKPVANNTVRALAVSPDGSTVYAGGNFTKIGSSAQAQIARLSASSGAPQSWSSRPGYPVYSIVATSSQVFIGGNGAGGHFAAYSTGGSQTWLVQTDGGVQAVAYLNGVLYVGGHYDAVCNGVSSGPSSGFHCPSSKAVRHKLLAVSASSGALDPWAPNPNSNLGVWALASAGSKLEVGGDFTAIGANPRSNQQGFAQFS